MFKLYRNFQAVQLNWIRKHPFQWLTLNVILFVVFIGFVEVKDLLEMRNMQNEIDQQD